MSFRLVVTVFATAVLYAPCAFAADAPEVKVVEHVVAGSTSCRYMLAIGRR